MVRGTYFLTQVIVHFILALNNALQMLNYRSVQRNYIRCSHICQMNSLWLSDIITNNKQFCDSAITMNTKGIHDH